MSELAHTKGTVANAARERNAFRPQKTAILLAQRIVGEITDQNLAPGTLLLPEREMLQRYGVARGTLREALRFLEIQGVLTIKPGPSGGPTVNTRTRARSPVRSPCCSNSPTLRSRRSSRHVRSSSLL